MLVVNRAAELISRWDFWIANDRETFIRVKPSDPTGTIISRNATFGQASATGCKVRLWNFNEWLKHEPELADWLTKYSSLKAIAYATLELGLDCVVYGMDLEGTLDADGKQGGNMRVQYRWNDEEKTRAKLIEFVGLLGRAVTIQGRILCEPPWKSSQKSDRTTTEANHDFSI